MMESPTIIAYIIGAFGLVATLTAAFVVVRSTRSKTTNQINEDNIKALQTQDEIKTGRLKDLESSNSDLSNQVIKLTSKVDTLSKIPLDKIEQHMADTNHILQTIVPLIGTSTKTIVSTTKVTNP